MKIVSIRKVSLLGLALIATSAVMAAFFSSTKKTSNIRAQDGRLIPVSADCYGNVQDTCITAAMDRNCHETTSHGFFRLSTTSGASECTSATTDPGNTTYNDVN